MIKPCGHRLVVKPVKLEDIDPTLASAKRSGLVLLETSERAEQSAVDQGVVITIGATAFKDFGGEAWCNVGDTVVYARHAGKRIKDTDGVEYLALNDEDVVAVIV